MPQQTDASALAGVFGRIHDTDSHEHIPSGHWAEAFGPMMGAFVDFLEEKHDPDATNSFTARVERDDAPLTFDSTWRRGAWAPGAIDMKRRVEVLDFMGCQDQMILSGVPGLLGQWLLTAPLEMIEYGWDIDIRTIGALFGATGDQESIQALCTEIGAQFLGIWNEWCVETARVSPRLRPTAFLDTRDVQAAIAEIERLASQGIRAFNIPSGMPPGGKSPGSPDVDPLWEAFVANDVTLVMHGGGDFGLLRSPVWPRYGPQNVLGKMKSYELNLDPYSVTQFHLGVQNFVILLVFGGVFERFPTLRVACLENGASWVGPTAANMELVGHQFTSLTKHLTLTPGEYMQRNVRVSPFFWEPVDDYIEKFGLEDVYVYGSDYPHSEGGWDPATQFAARLERLGSDVVEKFFVKNAELIMP